MGEEILRAAEFLDQIMKKKNQQTNIIDLYFEHQDIIYEDKTKNFLHPLLSICVLYGKLAWIMTFIYIISLKMCEQELWVMVLSKQTGLLEYPDLTQCNREWCRLNFKWGVPLFNLKKTNKNGMHRYICCYNRLQQPQCKKAPLCLVLIATSGVQYRKNKCLTISSHIHQSNNKHCFAVIFLV